MSPSFHEVLSYGSVLGVPHYKSITLLYESLVYEASHKWELASSTLHHSYIYIHYGGPHASLEGISTLQLHHLGHPNLLVSCCIPLTGFKRR
jgi:hypothetical protein